MDIDLFMHREQQKNELVKLLDLPRGGNPLARLAKAVIKLF